MRLLVVIPHYFGPAHPENNHPAIGSYIEPLGRIAALSETIAALHSNFGDRRHTRENVIVDGDPADGPRAVDIVIVAISGLELTALLGLDADAFEVEYVDCKPPWIAFEAQRIMGERSGEYDYYAYLEDDLIIHDPAFLEKLRWFQSEFGPDRLLMPTRFEMSMSGAPGKCIIDPLLPPPSLAPLRRTGQQAVLDGNWHGRLRRFALAENPHSAAYFISDEQLTHWMRTPTFDDRLDTWIGPLESAATLSVGRVFDLYKAADPNPFFLELQHYGSRYSAISPPNGRRYGEAPLLAIAQSAMRQLISCGDSPRDADVARVISLWRDQGTAVEAHANVDALQDAGRRHVVELRRALDEVASVSQMLRNDREAMGTLQNRLNVETARSQSVRWLVRRIGLALLARLGVGLRRLVKRVWIPAAVESASVEGTETNDH